MSQDVANNCPPGQSPPPKPAVKDDWTVHAIAKPKTADWDVPLDQGMLERLLMGFVPTAMEEKWFIYVEGEGMDSAEGELTLHFVRSWGCNEVARVNIVREKRDGNADGVPAARFTSVAWEGRNWKEGNVDGMQTKELVRDVCRLVMFVELPGGEEEEEVVMEEESRKERWWRMLMFWRR